MPIDHPHWGSYCEICFGGITVETCVTDTDGVKWDVHSGECAKQAGIDEADPPQSLKPRQYGRKPR